MSVAQRLVWVLATSVWLLTACGGGGGGGSETAEVGTAASNPVAVVPDREAPTPPSGLGFSGLGATSVILKWGEAADKIGVAGFDIYRDGRYLGSVGAAARSYADTTLSPQMTYRYQVKARDAAGNLSEPSAELVVQTPSQTAVTPAPTPAQSPTPTPTPAPTPTPTPTPTPSVDTIPPASPSGLTAVSPGVGSVRLTWVAGTDNVAVTAYRVYLNGALTATVATTQYTFTGLAAATDYTLQVSALDAAGNVSSPASLAWSAATAYRHGDSISIAAVAGAPRVTQTFLGGASGLIETTAEGAGVANGGGWVFNELGHPTRVVQDPKRGKVLFTPQDAKNYNATRRYDPGFAIPEKRYFYKAHWIRNVMLLDGVPYTKSYQWKHERVNWKNTIVDGDMEIKVHNWLSGAGLGTYVNRSASDKSTYWNSKVAPDSNGDWALLEMLVYTGTQGQTDGKLITRIHKNGKTTVNQNRQAERIYADPTMRLRYFIEQNYFGNFGQREDGVDNPLPKPQVRELYSDDSRVIVGNDAVSGWERIELRDTVSLQTAKLRELQSWRVWDGRIELTLNTGGLPRGVHDLHLVVISGLDADGLDIVQQSLPIRVQVD
jgi:chitodextrinase